MKIKYIALLLIGITMTSCVQQDYNFRSYVAAHRMSYTASEVLNRKLIQDNPAISETDKATFTRKLEAENLMITEAEKLLQPALPGVSK